MEDRVEERVEVHEIVKELQRATIADDAAAVARCIKQLESIDRKKTGKSVKPSAVVSRKRSISDDQFNRQPTKSNSNGSDSKYTSSVSPARSRLLEARPRSPKPRNHLREGQHRRDRSYAKAATTPQGTSLDAIFPSSDSSRRRVKPDVVEDSARCANWPKCQAGPGMIRDHGYCSPCFDSAERHETLRRTDVMTQQTEALMKFSAGVEQHVKANAEADAKLAERRAQLAEKAREVELVRLKEEEKLKREQSKRARKERRAKEMMDRRNLRS